LLIHVKRWWKDSEMWQVTIDWSLSLSICRARSLARTERGLREKCLILFFHCDNGFLNAPECYVIHTLPVLFDFSIVSVRFIVGIFFLPFRINQSREYYEYIINSVNGYVS
jgi:hypothetical protein